MKKLLLVPALWCVACADFDRRDEVVVGTAIEGDGTDGGSDAGTDTPGPTLVGGFIFEPNDCGDHSARIESHVGYSDGSSAENLVCQLVFEDGTVVDSCFAVHSFPEPQTVVLNVRDTVTGATASFQGGVDGPLSLNVTLDVTSDGLSISWDGDVIYGTTAGVGSTRVSIEPAANVIVDDPSIFEQRTGTVAVTAAGTYTVLFHGGVQFGEVGGCSAEITKTVDVVAVPCEH